MLWIRWSNCSYQEVNDTLHQSQNLSWYLLLSANINLPISTTAVMLNALSFVVFLRQQIENKAALYSLLSISIFEVLLQACISIENVLMLTRVKLKHSIAAARFTAVIYLCINTFLCMRNWNMLLITSARCEVVCRPLLARRFLFFNRGRLFFFQWILFSLALSLAILNNLGRRGKVCDNLPSDEDFVVSESFLDTHWWFSKFQAYGFFLYQSFLPVILIPIPTMIIWTKLRLPTNFHRRTSTLNRTSHKPNISSYKTSQLVLVLSLIFCGMNTPTFVISCISIPEDSFPPDIIGNALSVMDSVLNCFVYAASSRAYRLEVARMFHCRSILQADRRYMPNGAVSENQASGSVLMMSRLNSTRQYEHNINNKDCRDDAHLRLLKRIKLPTTAALQRKLAAPNCYSLSSHEHGACLSAANSVRGGIVSPSRSSLEEFVIVAVGEDSLLNSDIVVEQSDVNSSFCL